MNPTGIESHLKLVLGQWILIIACAWVFGRAGRRLGQPLAVGEILAGVLLGPSLFGALWPSAFASIFPPSTAQSMQLLGKLGLIFLLFQVGMEFDYAHENKRRLREQEKMRNGSNARANGKHRRQSAFKRRKSESTPRR